MIEKITELRQIANPEEEVQISKIIKTFDNYVSIKFEKNITSNEISDEKLEKGYKKAVDSIKELNELAIKTQNEKIFTEDIENKEEVEKFIRTVIDEIFTNRTIKRR